jgi:YidC/Oxa1 family membrane protein insertase
VTRLQPQLRRLLPFLLLLGLALLVAACASPLGGTAPGASGSPAPTHSQAPLVPASPGANPVELLAWLFTPIFQTIFIVLVFFDQLTKIIVPGGLMVVAILLLTLVIRLVTWPLSRRQLVSSRQTQLLQPELKAIQAKYKGDRVKSQAAVQEFYRQRGINPAGGCLPLLLTMPLLLSMYTVISQGLTNYDPSAMWHVFGINLFPGITCPTAPEFDPAGHVVNACLNPVSAGTFAWGLPEPVSTGFYIAGIGIGVLAIISALVQLVASRQAMPPVDPRTQDDPNIRVQRQMALFLPFLSLIYMNAAPAGLFIYWITSSVVQVIQQWLVFGWGGTFPLFGWYPERARAHRPRYHVTVPQPKPPKPGEKDNAVATRAKAVDRDITAQSTIRPNRQRSGRRGRRR